MVTFTRDSSVIFQLYVSPLTKPEMMTNRRTSTLTEVKTLLTQADSFTPNDRSPGRQAQRRQPCNAGVMVTTVTVLSWCVIMVTFAIYGHEYFNVLEKKRINPDGYINICTNIDGVFL